jgi:hypothetical protein
MQGLKHDRSARVTIAGHAFVQNVRRGHYELAVEVAAGQRLTVAFDALALAIWSKDSGPASACLGSSRCNSAATNVDSIRTFDALPPLGTLDTFR